jgi:hypothetical protein
MTSYKTFWVKREAMPVNIFSVSSDQHDVETLLTNVGDAVRQWEDGTTLSLDLSILLGETEQVGQQASELRGQWNVDSSAVIQSTRPGLGPWIIRFQKLVRRLTWWYSEPIIQQIRVFQRSAASTAHGLAKNQEKLLARYEELAAEQEVLVERLDALESGSTETDANANTDGKD